jgi:hypothetical protein
MVTTRHHARSVTYDGWKRIIWILSKEVITGR